MAPADQPDQPQFQRRTGSRGAAGPPGSRGPASSTGPTGAHGTFEVLTKRDAATGVIIPGEVSAASPRCEAGETPVSAGFRCDVIGPSNDQAYATVLTLTAIGAHLGGLNPGLSNVSCRGEVLCAS